MSEDMPEPLKNNPNQIITKKAYYRGLKKLYKQKKITFNKL